LLKSTKSSCLYPSFAQQQLPTSERQVLLTQKLRSRKLPVSSKKKERNADCTLSSKKKSAASQGGSDGKKSDKVGVNLNFLMQMKKLLPICVPGLFCRESGLLTILALILICRTYLDIWFSGFNGTVVKAIVSKDKKSFIKSGIYIFGLMMWPMVPISLTTVDRQQFAQADYLILGAVLQEAPHLLRAQRVPAGHHVLPNG
jgi:hypothetical protein